MAPAYAAIAERIAGTGLLPRGGFRPAEGDGVPPRADGRPVGALILIGNAGPGMWTRFAPFLEENPHLANPLDTWIERVVGRLGGELGAQPVFAHAGPPFHPFVRWAQRAEPVHPSPLRLLIHPRYGLWHAYRAALLFAEPVDLLSWPDQAAPCGACDRPCLRAPQRDGIDAARRACPVGREFTYGDAQAAFHQRAFLRGRAVR